MMGQTIISGGTGDAIAGYLWWVMPRDMPVCLDTELRGDAWAAKDAENSTTCCTWHELMSPSFSLERWWWGFASESKQGSMLSAHACEGAWKRIAPTPSCDVLWKELGYLAYPPTAIVLIWMTQSVAWNYHLPLVSRSELYFSYFFSYLFFKYIFNFFFNFPTSKIMIFLPHCFTPTHPHGQGQTKPLSTHSVWSSSGTPCPGAELTLGFLEGEGSTLEPGGSCMWKVSPAQQFKHALLQAAFTTPLSPLFLNVVFPSYACVWVAKIC